MPFTDKELAEGARGRAMVAEMVRAMHAALSVPPKYFEPTTPATQDATLRQADLFAACQTGADVAGRRHDRTS